MFHWFAIKVTDTGIQHFSKKKKKDGRIPPYQIQFRRPSRCISASCRMDKVPQEQHKFNDYLPVQQSSVTIRYRIQIILSCKCITQRNDPLSIIHNIQRFCQKLKDNTRLVLREIVHHLNTWPKKIQRKGSYYILRDSPHFKDWYGTSKLKYQTQTNSVQGTITGLGCNPYEHKRLDAAIGKYILLNMHHPQAPWITNSELKKKEPTGIRYLHLLSCRPIFPGMCYLALGLQDHWCKLSS